MTTRKCDVCKRDDSEPSIIYDIFNESINVHLTCLKKLVVNYISAPKYAQG